MSNLQDPRVLFALERTALAWNRSGLALIAFGFVIEKSNLLVQFGQSRAISKQNRLWSVAWDSSDYLWDVGELRFNFAISAWTSLINRTGIYRRLSDPTSSLAEFIYHADGYSIDDLVLDSLSLSNTMRCRLILDSTVDIKFA